MEKRIGISSRWIFFFLVGLVISFCVAISAHADTTIFNSWNADGTGSNPAIDPVFILNNPTTITAINNYHWNNGYGRDAGLINGWIGIDQILSETESVSVGRWPAVSRPGAFGSQNTQWYAYPNTVLGPGTYRVVDSDRASWSYTVTDYYGFLGITGKDWWPYKGFSLIWAAAADVCNDGLDNDGDGLLDLNDPDCPPAVTCVNPPSGMVAWWAGDGDAADIIGGRNGSPVNGALFSSGRVSESFQFTPQNYVAVVDDDVWTLGDGPFTIDLWVKFNSIQGRDPFIAHDESGGWYKKWIFWYDAYATQYGHRTSVSGPALRLHINSPALGPIDPIAYPWQPVPGQWYHVAITRNGSTYALYINGIQVTTATDTHTIPDPGVPLTIGKAEAYGFNGLIDEVEFFKRTLSPEEIASIFLAGSAGKCKNHPPVANAGPDQTVEITSCSGASVTLDGSGSSDPDGDALTYSWTWPGGSASGVGSTITLPYGTTTVTLSVDDGKGGTSTDTVDIRVVDMTSPTLSVTVEPNLLWPPNHKYVKVIPSVSVSDACAAGTNVKLVSVTSNEPDNGLGDGDTANDIIVNADGTVSLRAERSGMGSGRAYTITYQATDIGGNTTTTSATVTVPHNK